MKYLTLETFKDFVCIGSDCSFTCCRDWKITIDEETDRFYQSVDGEMGERLKRCIQHENGEARFILEEGDARCPFLNEKGLCSIYINLGEEHLSNTCKYYPRYLFSIGDICFAGVSISCPETARFFLTHEEPLLIDYAETEDNADVDTNTDWEQFNYAIRTFSTAVSIAQNRDLSIKERIALVILLVSGFQESVGEGRDPSSIIGLYSNPDYYSLILDQTGIKNCDLESKVSFVTGIISLFNDTKHLDTKLPELAEVIEYYAKPGNSSVDPATWEKAFITSMSSDNEIWVENVLVYILFKYFMKGLYEKNYLDEIMKGIVPVLYMSTCITALYNVIHHEEPSKDYIITLVARLSRIIEHNSSAGETVIGFFREQGFTDPGFVLRLIS